IELSRRGTGRQKAPARNQQEEVLTGIWASVLGLDDVGIHDNFFDLGGDSISGIQTAARARQAGFHLTPKDILTYPTVAELASVVGIATIYDADQGIITGPVPLTAIQHWFLEEDLPDPNHWNQTILVEVHRPVDLSILRAVVQRLIEHHDALRL